LRTHFGASTVRDGLSERRDLEVWALDRIQPPYRVNQIEPPAIYLQHILPHTVDSLSAPAHRLLMATILLLVAASVFNVAWEINSPHASASLRTAGGGRLIDLARAEKSSLPGKVGFALSLRRVASGGVLIVPDSAAVERRQIELLSAMTIVVEDYDPRLDPGLVGDLRSVERVEGLGKMHFNDAELSAYIIAWKSDGEPVDVMRLYWTSRDTMVVLDERFVDEIDQ
jgi:hypothetical protein